MMILTVMIITVPMMIQFCMSCGAKVGETELSTLNNMNKSLNKTNDSIDKVSNDFSDSFSDLINIYKINMMDCELVIRHSEIHQGCLYAPLLLGNIISADDIYPFYIVPTFYLSIYLVNNQIHIIQQQRFNPNQ